MKRSFAQQKGIAEFESGNKNDVSSTTNEIGTLKVKSSNQRTKGASTKVLFNVVWREPSSKKHKAWQGDGVLEVHLDEKRIELKDATGKCMGTIKPFADCESLKEGVQLTVGGKETELLEEVTDKCKYGAMIELQQEMEEKCGRKAQDRLKSSMLHGKTIFKVVWREISNKKHKIWKGDGTFEMQLHENRGVLKDDKGAYMGTTTAFDASSVQEGLQLLVGGKEIELLEEIKSNEEYWILRRQQVDSRGWGQDEFEKTDEPSEKKRKGSFFFQSYLGDLKLANTAKTKRRLQQVDCQYLPRKHEYICFVRPSELQYLMLKKAFDFYRKRKEFLLKEMSPLQITTVLKKICNHPSLIGRTKSSNLLTRHFERYLPDWTEMGPFDSTKLEFVQNFLNEIVVRKREKCILVSHYIKTLNMLQGLCDHLNLKCLRLDGLQRTTKENKLYVEQFNTSVTIEEVPVVVLLSANAESVELNLISVTRLIFFDNDWNPATDAQIVSYIWRDDQQRNVHIYRLVTAASIEEKIFQQHLATAALDDDVNASTGKNLLDLFSEQEEFDFCQTHESLNCNCEGKGENLLAHNAAAEEGKGVVSVMQWKHYQPPFNETFLKETGLKNVMDNIIYMFVNQMD